MDKPRYSSRKDTIDVRREDVRSLLYLVIIAVFLGTLMVMLPGSTAEQKSTLEDQVLLELSNHDEVTPYLDSETHVDYLSEKDLEKLADDQPAIYAGVPPGSYQVLYRSSDGPGLLIIYDLEADRILNLFSVQNFMI